MQRSQVLDLYFVDARSKLIDIAAFLDRAERAEGADDYRLRAFREALSALAAQGGGANRAERVLLAFSDPTSAPVEQADGKAATGAWRGEGK
ncbi:MAG: hypothetical protein PHQ12_04165 [Chthoniobacteraceae bacterium]|nr:hypothetical protein [Chthoniobacteraceae bacterium]